VRPSYPRCHARNEWPMLVAILGTTISPYLFFWQASEEIEEEKSAGQITAIISYIQLPRDRRQQLLPAIKFESKLRCTQPSQLYALRSCRSCPGRILLPS
jgi:Mn2+/Fe2+ NRAMP family transporter